MNRITLARAPVLVTAAVLVSLYVAAGLRYPGFFSLRVGVNFLGDNAVLGILALGLTLVILTGGIDLSVGAAMGAAGIATAALARAGWHPFAAIAIVIAAGLGFGSFQGWLIQRFVLPPFLVTLAGLFVCRGLGLWISSESIAMKHGSLDFLLGLRIPLAKGVYFPFEAIVFVLFAVVAAVLAKWTRFGRTLYAIGGHEASARLMGLPVARTKVLAYAWSGFCAASGGVLFAITTRSGNAVSGVGTELDAIAAVVMGGTLLSGGYGAPFGTVLGLLIFAVIQSAITFDGTLSSWWTKIVTGGLLLGFIALQKVLERSSRDEAANSSPSNGSRRSGRGSEVIL